MSFLDNLRYKVNNFNLGSNLKHILFAIIIIVVIVLVINYLTKTQIKLAGTNNASKLMVIPSNKLVNKNNTNNYTYSLWMYVNDWNYRYGQNKVILERVDNLGNPTPSVKLGALENNVTVSVACYPDVSNNTTTNPIIKDCVIRNVPIQRWTNLIVSLYGRTLDIYLDGKLVRTCVLPGVPKVNQKSDVNVTPNGGFSGFTSNIVYINTASNPRQAYNIYKKGSGSSVVGSFFNKYKIKLSLLDNSNVKGSIEI
jgi:hypothetical protein